MGVRKALLQQLLVKGEQLEGKSQVERDVITNMLLGQRGANQTVFPCPTLRVHRARKSDCNLHVII